MEYPLGSRTLIWDFDPAATGPAAMKDDNLSIPGLWNMRDTVGHPDVCVALEVLSGDSFSFLIFNGVRYTVRLEGDRVILVKKTVVK